MQVQTITLSTTDSNLTNMEELEVSVAATSNGDEEQTVHGSYPPSMYGKATDRRTPSPNDYLAAGQEVDKALFAEAGTMPVPDAGYHQLGVVWQGLTVHGADQGHKLVQSFEISMLKMWDIPGFFKQVFNIQTGKTRPLISNFDGVAPEGQTMLVLGRPGAGCSTLLRSLANVTEPFVKIDGDVAYSSIPAGEAKRYFDGEIIFNAEEDEHTPLLSVGHTLGTALAMKEPRKKAIKIKTQDYVDDMAERLLNAFGMPHTKHTMVGNQFFRGVSGGERKRVSLSEIFTTNAAVICWDNAIRGLDSAVALHFFKILRELSRSTGMTNIITTYQTSQDAWITIDRVVVLYEGRQIFSGRASDAEEYFIEMGYYKKPRQTTPDFLTAVTSPVERQPREGFEGRVPTTPDEFVDYFRAGPYYTRLQQDIDEYKSRHASSNHADEFRQAVKDSKHFSAGKRSAFRVSLPQQIMILVRRQIRLIKADLPTFVTQISSNVLQATLVGAVCYKPANDANGSFAIAGALFFCILYFVIFALGEVPNTVMGRRLLLKHRALGFYHPAAYTIAQIITDVPIYALQTLVFSSILYFLVGLNSGAQYFFTFWFIIFTLYEALSCMYRMIGSWTTGLSVAIRYGALALSIVLASGGFISPPPRQLGWISWLRRASPAAWAFEALMANEFRTRTLTCTPDQLIPTGPTYGDVAYQICSIVGARPGTTEVTGSAYIETVYGFSSSSIWRNIGILWAFFVLYMVGIFIGSSLLVREVPGSAGAVYKRGGKSTSATSTQVAEQSSAEKVSDEKPTKNLTTAPIYTFQDIKYTVKINGNQDKVLLDGVSGLVRPGALTALMGSSGSGKTTLLDTISCRKTTGKIEGEMLIDGKRLDLSFSRRTGFASQADVHEPYSTVRECLQFSALLRQDNERTREEKLEFAEEIIRLLELGPIADAMIGEPGAGLGVEERKRVTIGVELAADPAFLLFLDEPTSGLDSQASYDIVRFLKKIAASGLAVLCTIHQPSGDLFEMFDAVVLLAPGGKTVYAGPTGENAHQVTGYFAGHGAVCPPDANPPEFILSTVAPVGGSRIDWPLIWNQSPEAQKVLDEISTVNARNTGSAAAHNDASGSDTALATSYWQQTRELTIRNFRAQWRAGSFWTSQIMILVFFGLFIGFYLFKLDHTPNNMQSATLGVLVSVQGLPAIALDIAINFLQKFDLYVARERLGIYSWYALVTSLLIVALPVLVIGYTLLFFCNYWTMGFGTTAENGALIWLLWVAIAFFTASCGLLLGAVSPSPFAVPYILSLVWNLFNVLSWALVVYNALPSPFHYFFSWLTPLRYLYGSMMTASIGDLSLQCIPEDFLVFDPPPNQSCGDYAAAFLSTATGYLSNPDAFSQCQYCSSTSGIDYIHNLGYSDSTKWRDWGIFIVFNISNIFFIYLLTWLVKIRPLYKK